MNWFKDKDLTDRVNALVRRADDQRKQLDAFKDSIRLEQDISREYDVGDIRVYYVSGYFE